MIIGLVGYARSGKDTIAAMLPGDRWCRLAFADALKTEVLRMLEKTRDLNWLGMEHNKEKLRPFLVFWGEFRRQLDRDYWIKIVQNRRMSYGDSADFIVTDVRYLNEAEYVKRQGGIVVWVERGREPANETERDTIEEIRKAGLIDREIDNRGDLMNTARQLLEIIGDESLEIQPVIR